jgi:hypothetical protein
MQGAVSCAYKKFKSERETPFLQTWDPLEALAGFQEARSAATR